MRVPTVVDRHEPMLLMPIHKNRRRSLSELQKGPYKTADCSVYISSPHRRFSRLGPTHVKAHDLSHHLPSQITLRFKPKPFQPLIPRPPLPGFKRVCMPDTASRPPYLFTPYSPFAQNRTLPIPGSQPTDMDKHDPKVELDVGQIVKVRRFKPQAKNWTVPRIGTVIRGSPIRGYLGTHARGVVVETRSGPTGSPEQRCFAFFLGEVAPMDEEWPQMSALECWERRKAFDWIYALVPLESPARMNGEVPLDKIWTPVSVITIEPFDTGDPNLFSVFILAGPLKETIVKVKRVHPFNEATSFALRRSGQYTMALTGEVLPPILRW
ncbi:hypothetical protein DL96DRAFT_1761399 [Flagelloscypha sp. PMI_526]|nr:hypothetical protein DL96DRAFT_1761399 [Flagelloscypha sp. PMI_526]